MKAAEKPRLTVPEAYEFDDRQKKMSQTQSIRQRKVAEIVAAAAAKDEMEMSKTFHPKPIPDHVKNVHLFEQIMAENEQRRETVRQTSMALTQKNEKPFSFYDRDRENQKSKRYLFLNFSLKKLTIL